MTLDDFISRVEDTKTGLNNRDLLFYITRNSEVDGYKG